MRACVRACTCVCLRARARACVWCVFVLFSTLVLFNKTWKLYNQTIRYIRVANDVVFHNNMFRSVILLLLEVIYLLIDWLVGWLTD